MKKLTAWMLALCLVLPLLSACGAKAPAEPAPEVTKEQSETQAQPEEKPAQPQPAAEPEQPEQPDEAQAAPVREGYAVEGEYFTIWLPESWKDQVVIHESNEENYYLAVSHKASEEVNGQGFLFSLALDDTMDFIEQPSYQVIGVLTDGTQRHNLFATFPTDVQAAEGLYDEYAALFDEDVMNQIFSQIEPKPGWTLEDMPEDVLYDAQSHYEYLNTMFGVFFSNQLPDGTEVVPEDWDAKMDDNHFAVLDVDGDGRDELLISVDNSYMAGMVTVVYSLGETGMEEELRVFPGANFYTGGLVQSFASHNHTFGEIWPYSLLRYDAQSGEYQPIADVYGWVREYSETDYEGNPFPADVDADGNGSVFSITEGNSQRWVDDAVFQQWEAEQFSGAEEIQISWLPITEENINTIYRFG